MSVESIRRGPMPSLESAAGFWDDDGEIPVVESRSSGMGWIGPPGAAVVLIAELCLLNVAGLEARPDQLALMGMGDGEGVSFRVLVGARGVGSKAANAIDNGCECEAEAGIGIGGVIDSNELEDVDAVFICGTCNTAFAELELGCSL